MTIGRILLIAALLPLAGGAWYGYANFWRAQPVTTAIAVQAPVSEAIYGTGTVEPERWA
jgi:multidrug efflux pump subunit AcrA (membrane-fusion protein)